jgi:hypothetical protein
MSGRQRAKRQRVPASAHHRSGTANCGVSTSRREKERLEAVSIVVKISDKRRRRSAGRSAGDVNA